jgi:uncharacterized protein DUF3592
MNGFNPTALIAGGAFAIGGLVRLIQRINLYRHSVMTEGRVIDSVIARHIWTKPLSSPSYRFVVEFAVAGSAFRVTSHTSSFSKPCLGLKYPVRYDPRDPAGGCIATTREFWVGPISALVFGVALPIVAFAAGR